MGCHMHHGLLDPPAHHPTTQYEQPWLLWALLLQADNTDQPSITETIRYPERPHAIVVILTMPKILIRSYAVDRFIWLVLFGGKGQWARSGRLSPWYLGPAASR